MSGFSPQVSWSIARRQLGSFLANPVGYLFILAFVVAAACVAFLPDGFRQREVADMGLLYVWMPWILMLLIPALGMGAWATEREHGTDELMLTLPVSIADAVIGKFTAILTFFTLALAFNVSNVVMLMWLGDPDLGQMFANHLGWWCLAVGYTALALLGSVLARSQSIAFVLGVLLCGVFAGVVMWTGLLTPFDRGQFSLDLFLIALAVAGAALGSACLVLASGRWHPERSNQVTGQVVCLILAVLVAINIGRIAQRSDMRVDLSTANISSLSAGSEALVNDLAYPAEVVLVISDDSVLPEDLAARALELRAKAEAIQAASDGRIGVSELRPVDPYDDQGRQARDTYGIIARPNMADTVIGREEIEAFLGAVITCGPQTISIPYFEPGLSVEYELIRALRTAVARAQVRPDVSVKLVVSEPVPAAARERADAVLAWAEQQSMDGVEVSIERVSDAVAAATADRLELEMVTPARADSESAQSETNETETVADSEPFVLGAVVEGPKFSARVRSFTDMDAIEREVRSAIRRARRPLPVIGVLDTDLELNGGMDLSNPMSPGKPEWGIVGEWGKQYNVRPIAPDTLDVAGLDDVDVLVAALPSSLSPEPGEVLIEWVWSGRPTLLLADPMPFFPLESGQLLAAAAPPQPKQPVMPGLPQSPPQPKAGAQGLQPLFTSLGLNVNLNAVLWSKYTPSQMFANLPPEFVWVDRVNGGFGDDEAITRGIQSLLMIAPATIRVLEDATTQVQPLVTLGGQEQWDIHAWSAYVTNDRFGRQVPTMPDSYRVSALKPDDEPHLAVRVTGTMAHPERNEPSPRDVDVVVVSDADLIHDAFFNLYRRVPTGPDGSQGPSELSNLRNVQFVENIIDVLVQSTDLVELRANRPVQRALTRIQDMRSEKRQKFEVTRSEAQLAAEEAIAEEQLRVNEKVDQLMARTDIDNQRKMNEQEFIREQAERRLSIKRYQIEQEAQAKVRAARAEFRESVGSAWVWMVFFVVSVPAALLVAVVIVVVLVRLAGERMDIPSARDRRNA